eukprot:31158-Pelagococcus_subviridis.AAC.3
MPGALFGRDVRRGADAHGERVGSAAVGSAAVAVAVSAPSSFPPRAARVLLVKHRQPEVHQLHRGL